MSHVASSTAEPDDRPINLVRASDIEKSSQQIGQLLNIAGHAGQFLIRPDNFDERVEVDPTAAKVALSTFELAHQRMRDLIDEQNRWGLNPTPSELDASKVLAASARLGEAKTEIARIQSRPSIFLRPKISRFTVGWIAWVGGDAPDKGSLHGIGATPAKAFEAFDSCFYDLQAHAPGPADTTAPVKPATPARKTPRKKHG